jgi:hypothetical protein
VWRTHVPHFFPTPSLLFWTWLPHLTLLLPSHHLFPHKKMSIRKRSQLSPDLIIAISIVVLEKVVKDDVKRNRTGTFMDPSCFEDPNTKSNIAWVPDPLRSYYQLWDHRLYLIGISQWGELVLSQHPPRTNCSWHCLGFLVECTIISECLPVLLGRISIQSYPFNLNACGAALNAVNSENIILADACVRASVRCGAAVLRVKIGFKVSPQKNRSFLRWSLKWHP